MFAGTLLLRQGKPFRFEFSINDADDGEPESLRDLSAYSFRMQIRARFDSPGVLIDISTANGNVTYDSLNRMFVVLVQGAISSAIVGFTKIQDFVSDIELFTALDADIIDGGSYQIHWEPEATKQVVP